MNKAGMSALFLYADMFKIKMASTPGYRGEVPTPTGYV